MLDWLENHRELLLAVGLCSVLLFVASILLIPPIVTRIRADYFTHEHRPPSRWAAVHPVVQWSIRVGRGLFGIVLIILGIAMLVLPGQGILTIFVGILLIEFPGKYALEKWLIQQPCVLRPINWLRGRKDHPPLQTPDDRSMSSAS